MKISRKVGFVLFSPTFYHFGLEIVKSTIDLNLCAGFIALTRGHHFVEKKLRKVESCYDVFSSLSFAEGLTKQYPSHKPSWFDREISRFDNIYGDGSLMKLVLSDRSLSPYDVSLESRVNYELNHSFLHKVGYGYNVFFVLMLESALRRYMNSYNISYFLCFSASEVYTMTVELICKRYSIPFNHIDTSRIQDFYYIAPATFSNLQPARELYFSGKSPSSKAIKFANDFVTSFRSNPQFPAYEVSNRNTLLSNSLILAVSNLLKALLQGGFGILFSKAHLVQSLLKIAEFKRVVHKQFILDQSIFQKINSLPNNKYILFALHVTPEKSTSVDCPEFTSHYEYIKKLSLELPADVFIYVKEHVHMLGRRKEIFYKKLLSLPKVKLVDPYIPLFSLIPDCLGIASINSTCGYEALIFNKPVLYASFNAFYANLPYTYFFQEPIQFREFISLIGNPGVVDRTVCSNAITLFIAHIFAISFRLPYSTLWMQYSKSRQLTREQIDVAKALSKNIVAK